MCYKLQNIHQKESEFFTIYHLHPEPIFICDVNGTIQQYNKQVFNFVQEHCNIQRLETVYELFQNENWVEGLFENVKRRQEVIHHETTLYTEFPIYVTAIPLSKTSVAFILQDMSRVKESKHFIQYFMYYDELTNLPNEKAISEQLKQICKSANTRAAIIKVNLNRFKYLSDMYGNEFRDQVILYVAKLLKENISKPHFVGRLSTDEFIIIIKDVKNKEQTISFIQQKVDNLDQKFVFKGQEIYYDFQVGIAFYPEDGNDAETLIQNSEIAAKIGLNKNKKVCLFNPLYGQPFYRKAMMERDLYQAIKKNELELYYQPIIDTKSCNIAGFEVLLRWKHKNIGMISPEEFIPIAEETGFIIEIGRWSMEEALKQLCIWRNKGYKNLKISLNWSIRQFFQQDLLKMINSLLNKYNIPPECLELEITESHLMYNIDYFLNMIKELKELSVNVSIDDFGTGYSSLSYLTKLKLDKIKIDRSFIQNLDRDEENNVVVKTVISLAKNLQLSIIAEGVEKQEHISFLHRHQCYYMQGYYFSKPVCRKEAEHLLEHWNKQGC